MLDYNFIFCQNFYDKKIMLWRILMYKRILLVLFTVLLSACSSTKDVTISDLFGWCFSNKTVKEINVQEVELEEKYILAKRGDRYESAEYVIEPQVYRIVASRTVNKMLLDAPAIFATNKEAPLYIDKTVQADRFLPINPDVAENETKEIIIGSQMFNVVDKKEDATYILESSIRNIGSPEIPVIVYNLKMVDNSGVEYGNWSESIRQIQNDDGSWW